MGADVIMACRSPKKGQKAIESIQEGKKEGIEEGKGWEGGRCDSILLFTTSPFLSLSLSLSLSPLFTHFTDVKRMAKEYNHKPGSLEVIQMDLSSFSSIRSFVDKVKKRNPER